MLRPCTVQEQTARTSQAHCLGGWGWEYDHLKRTWVCGSHYHEGADWHNFWTEIRCDEPNDKASTRSFYMTD